MTSRLAALFPIQHSASETAEPLWHLPPLYPLRQRARDALGIVDGPVCGHEYFLASRRS